VDRASLLDVSITSFIGTHFPPDMRIYNGRSASIRVKEEVGQVHLAHLPRKCGNQVLQELGNMMLPLDCSMNHTSLELSFVFRHIGARKSRPHPTETFPRAIIRISEVMVRRRRFWIIAHNWRTTGVVNFLTRNFFCTLRRIRPISTSIDVA